MTLLKLPSTNDYRIIIPCFGLAGLIMAAAFFPYGELRMTYDSYDLIAASESFKTYLIGKNKDGHSYLVRAPLHPFLLSIFHNKIEAMWWINVSSFMLALILLFRIARLKGLSGNAAAAIVGTVIAFYPWLMNFQFFWTESIFIVLILLLCYALLAEWPVVGVIGICLMLFLTRKAGIFFFVSAAASYWGEKDKKHAFSLFGTGLLVFALWQWLEFLYSSTGQIGVMLKGLHEYHRIHYLDAVTSWILPMQIPLLFRSILVALILLLVLYLFKHEIFSLFLERRNVVLLSVAGVYSFILISFSGTTGYEDAERYLNVVYPIWVILGTSIVVRIIEVRSKNQRIWVLGAVALWLLYPFLRTAHHLVWPLV